MSPTSITVGTNRDPIRTSQCVRRPNFNWGGNAEDKEDDSASDDDDDDDEDGSSFWRQLFLARLDRRWPEHGPPPLRCQRSSYAPRVLLADRDYVVIDKPPDVSHDGGQAVTVDALAREWVGEVKWAHRLDYGTSGVLLGSRHKSAASKAAAAFERGTARKRYVAVAVGTVEQDTFEINAPIAPTPTFRMRVSATGKTATTGVIVLARATYRGRPVTKLLLCPRTGRRHQLRVHLRYCGHPLVGDATYDAGPFADAPRMMLHAIDLRLPIDDHTFLHATSGDPFPIVDGCLRPRRLVDIRSCQASLLRPVPKN
ncbi:hypothetical protein CTAYLR_000124 [Chrysophaeum taylorii]|uniref:Pseudouridine synthase RsuA/RluA-like domain-containing protein n=1 Tax=Chrysophaeum taylorii TaxID=2483200 RepID=A0AAD7UGQ9_9STRA|nr:hypothetical protein CTAYLR_000124 [Chrysophaeum taylorii]